MNTTNKRVWVFVAYRNEVPYFSKLFTDYTELKEFSANHSQKEKHDKKVPNYHSTYLDLTDNSLLTQAHQQGEREGVESFVKELDKLIHLQASVLQTEISDAYMHGLVNGLLTSKAVATGDEQTLFEEIGGKYVQLKI